MLQFGSAKFLTAVMIPLFLLALPSHAHAATVSVGYTQSPVGSMFRYDFSITDIAPANQTLLSVTLSVPAQANAVQNLMAPTGFSAFFDAGLGLVDFVEGSSQFRLGVPVNGFSFVSPFRLVNPAFTTLALDPSQNPVTSAGIAVVTPEPASLGLMATALFFLAGCGLRKLGSGAIERRSTT